MKIYSLSKCFAAFTIFTTAILSHAQNLSQLASAMELEINHGQTTNKDVRVKALKERFFLEGGADRDFDRKRAVEICTAYAANYLKNNKSPFKQPNELCVNLVLLRQPWPLEASGMFRVEYRVLYLPDSPIGASNLLSEKFFAAPALPSNARLLKTVSFNLQQDNDGSFDGRHPMSTQWVASERNPTAALASETFSDPQNASAGFYSFTSESRAISVPASDKINLDVDLKITNPKMKVDRHIKTRVVLANGQTAGLASWVHLDESSSQAPGMVVLVRIDKLRSITQSPEVGSQ